MQGAALCSLLLSKSFLICNEETLVAFCVILFVFLTGPSLYERIEELLLDLESGLKSQKNDWLANKCAFFDSYRNCLGSVLGAWGQKVLIFWPSEPQTKLGFDTLSKPEMGRFYFHSKVEYTQI